MLKQLYKPEYFYRPLQILNRLAYSFRSEKVGMRPVKLVWGQTLWADPKQTIGRSLFTFGLYDLALSETIFRFVRPGDTVIDVGANIGYTSKLMLDCLKSRGILYSFEPLPSLFKILEKNLKSQAGPDIRLMNMAVSDTNGEATLTLPNSFEHNDGIATLEERSSGTKVKVKKTTLDSLNLNMPIRLMKVDVEGHELSVFKGAEETFKRELIDIILYEDLEGGKGLATDYLISQGFKVYKLVKDFTGLRLASSDFVSKLSYEPDNLIATKNTDFLKLLESNKKWTILNHRNWKK